MLYQIKIIGELDQSWADWLGEMSLTSERGGDGAEITTLIVDAPDQPALFGVLDHIRDLNLLLISVDTRAANP